MKTQDRPEQSRLNVIGAQLARSGRHVIKENGSIQTIGELRGTGKLSCLNVIYAYSNSELNKHNRNERYGGIVVCDSFVSLEVKTTGYFNKLPRHHSCQHG